MTTPALAVAPNAGNLYVGRGKLYFDRFVTNTTTRQGEFDLGNITALELSPKPEIKKKYESMDPSSLLYGQAVTRQDVNLKVTGDEFAMFNLAAVLLGDQAQFTQSAVSTITAASLTSTPLNGAWYQTGYRNITVTSVQQGSTAGVLGTDYNVDLVSGRIQIFTTGAFTASTATTWTGSAAAATYNMVQASTVGTVEGYLRFKGNPVKGPTFEIEAWHVVFTPTGNLGLIADDYGNWSMDGSLIADTINHPSEPFFHVIQIA